MGNGTSKPENSYFLLPDSFTGKSYLKRYQKLTDPALGSRVVACSDESFGPAKNILLPQAQNPSPIFKSAPLEDGMKNEPGKDVWETRRHNEGQEDWVIIKLAYPATLSAIQIDTRGTNANLPESFSLEGLYYAQEDEHILWDPQLKWCSILPKIRLQAERSQFFGLNQVDLTFSHIRLKIYPDGAISRFHAYGSISPRWPDQTLITQTDLSFIGNGSRVISCSDGDASCLIYPGTGQSCDDGWETRRSRLANHADWAVIRLGCPGKVEWAEIDTKLCKGKQPKHAGLFGCFSNEENPEANPKTTWYPVLEKQAIQGDLDNRFELTLNQERVFTHIKLCIYPDGCVQRLRIYGTAVSLEEARRLGLLIASHTVFDTINLTEEFHHFEVSTGEQFWYPSGASESAQAKRINRRTSANFENLAKRKRFKK